MSFWSPPVAIPVVQDFTPVSSGVYSIGSTALRWKDGWFSGTIVVDTVDVATKLTVGGTTGELCKAFLYANDANTVSIVRQDGAGNIADWRTASGTNVASVKSGGIQLYSTNKVNFTNTLDQTYVRGSASNTLAFGTNSTDRWQIDAVGMLRALNGSLSRGAPITKTADWTVQDAENWFISNRAATNTVTLPAAASYTGREIMIKTIQAQAVVSASANVVPLVGGAAGTAILAATAGRWATLVSDGANWIIMQAN